MFLFVLFAAIAIGFWALFVALRRSATAHAEQSQEQAVSAAVSAVLSERSATTEALGRERSSVVETAVTRAAEVADQKLDARLRAGTEQLDARFQQGTERLEANLKLGHLKYDSSTSALEKQNNEVKREMQRIEKMITDLQEKSAGQHGAVVNQLQQHVEVTSKLQHTTGSLREALGNSRKRGSWGERMAQDVLTHAGMKEGINYEVQKGTDAGGRPDYTFTMPQDMVMHMDVKFPADNYLAFLDAEQAGTPDADQFRKRFIKDARNRVKELSDRRYHEERNSVDTVVLFIPNESIFAFVQENDPGLMDTAMESKIVLCGPSTLIAVMQVVRQAMDSFMLEQRSNEIMGCLADFKKEWEKFSDKVDQHGKQLNTAMNSFNELAGARSNQLGRQVRKIDALQAAPLDAPAALGETGELKVEDVEVSENEHRWPELREVSSA